MEEGSRKNLQYQGLDTLRGEGQPQFTNTFFPYTSGEIGPYYIDCVAITNNGLGYRAAIGALQRLVITSFDDAFIDVFAGGESRDWDFSNPLAIMFQKPHAKVYKDGTIRGAKVQGKNVAWVADLNNEGSSMRDKWKPAIERQGGKIVCAFFYVDRMEDGVQVMNDLGIPNASVVPFDNAAWEYLEQVGYISPQLRASLDERMLDKQAWAHRMLRSPEGVAELERLLGNDRTYQKAALILQKGYPELQDFLVSTIRSRGFVSEEMIQRALA